MNDYQTGTFPTFKVIHCPQCGREFRGIYPGPTMNRHLAEHRAAEFAELLSRERPAS